jgi:hypothetical protein
LRFTRRPSSGPMEPEMLELPKSLKKTIVTKEVT